MKQAKLLTDAEFKRLTAVINSLRYQTRNHTIVALSFYAGLRACEIAALRVEMCLMTAVVLKTPFTYLIIKPKDHDSCTVLVNSKLQRQLEKYARSIPNNTK